MPLSQKPTPPSISWQETMAVMAARWNDANSALWKLDVLLASGRHTANQLRRAEEDALNTYRLFITATIESYPQQ